MSVDSARTYLSQAQALIAQALGELAPTNVLFVKKGDNLQAAIDGAPSGAVIRVFPDTYDGIVLRGRKANITICPDTAALPPAGGRIDPSFAAATIQLRPNAGPLPTNIVTEAGASGYQLIGVNCLPGRPDVAMAVLGDDVSTDPLQQPDAIVFDRCLFLADPAKGGKRGIAANTRGFSLLGSYFDDFWWQDDSQAVGAWNGPGPFTIINNHLVSSGENVMFGGADARSAAMMPSELTMRFNYCTKKLSWYDPVAGKGIAGHTVKDVIEMKAMLTALIEFNLFEYSWISGQSGYGVVFTPRNQNGTAPFTQLKDITFQNNIVRNVGAGFNILGDDNLAVSARTTNLRILNNLLYNVDPKLISGQGRLIQVDRGPVQVEIGHNTLVAHNHNSFLALAGATPKADQFNMHDNVLYEGSYGIAGNGTTPGAAAFDAFTSGSAFEHNLIARQVPSTVRTVKYPGAVNYETAVGEDAVDPKTMLLAAKFAGLASSDGKPLGCDVASLLAAIPGVTL